MIDQRHHIEINGVLYRVAESEAGDHYVLNGEPLRPPNSVVVQGTERQDLFQMRADVLLWKLTDWSGGEGQYKYDSSASHRHAFLRNVDAFSRPGTVRPGPAMRAAQDSTGSADFVAAVTLVPIDDKLWAVSTAIAGYVYVWDGAKFDAGHALTDDAPGNVCTKDGVCSDDLSLFYLDATTGYLYKINQAYSSDRMDDDAAVSPSQASLRELDDYVYSILPQQGKVYEMAKSETGAGTWTVLDDRTWGGAANADDSFHFQTAVAENRLFYMYATEGGKTWVREITPTGTDPGFVSALATIPGVVGTSLWYHGGFLYMTAWAGAAANKDRILFYIDPSDGTYGIVDTILPDFPYDGANNYDGKVWGNEAGSGLATSLMTMFDAGSVATQSRIYEMSTISGGLAQLSAVDRDQDDTAYPAVRWQGEPWMVVIGTGATVFIGADGTFIDSDDADGGIFVTSPWHDFGLTSSKILSRILIQHEELPADWEVKVYYAMDGDPSYTLAGTSDTDGDAGGEWAVSTDSATVSFISMQVKVVFTYTGALAAPTTAPVLLGIEVRAQVAKPQRVWHLMLDLSDDQGNASQSHSGTKKYTNIATAGDTEEVIDFKDGYPDRRVGEFTQYDVVVDAYQLVLTKPGEGYARTVLREMA